MADIELISNYLCPYTQRAAIQLAEKGREYERVYIDLADKPEWFLQLSPLGKVPLLRTGDAVVFETWVICEYIEETHPAVPMLPHEPLGRAHQRSWSEFASAVIADIFGFYSAADAMAFERKRGDLSAKFQWLERHFGDGHWFAGAHFCIVDAAFAPVFRLFETFDRIADFGSAIARVIRKSSQSSVFTGAVSQEFLGDHIVEAHGNGRSARTSSSSARISKFARAPPPYRAAIGTDGRQR